MLWFFKKKEEKVGIINSKLQNSFSNLKQDISTLYNWIEHFKEEHTNHKSHHKKHYDNHNNLTNEIKILKEELKEMRQILYSKRLEDSKDINEISKKRIVTPDTNFLTDLMPTQEKILMNLIGLINETGSEWIPMKEIARGAYPEKEYSKIKSMVSNHTDFFLTFGLVEKKRKGRQTYVSLTEKGKEIFKNNLEKGLKVKAKR